MRLTDRQFRGVEKSDKPIAVQCSLTNCVFHEGPSPYPGNILCSHKHKKQHMIGTCPLYHLDWLKQAQAVRR